MLPAEVLGYEHRDLCAAKDITQIQRHTLRQFNYFFPSGPSHTGFGINRLLALAEQGYPEAQGTLGAFCDADMEQRVFPL